MSWRKLFPLALLFTCVDGFFANWFYPAKLPLLYRDFLILFVYFLFFTREPVKLWISRLRERMGPQTWLWGLLFLLAGLPQIFNPSLPNIWVGLLGFKVSFFYWPLAILAYAYVDRITKARRLIKMIVFLSIPINLFGLYQFLYGADFLTTTFGPGFERAIQITMFEGSHLLESKNIRVFSTFASSGQYSAFLVVNGALLFALLLTSRKVIQRWFYVSVAILNFVALLASGSRGQVLSLMLCMLPMGLFCANIRKTFRVASVTAISLFIGFSWLGEPVVKRFGTLSDPKIIRERTFVTTPLMFAETFAKHPLGKGLGIGSTAARHLFDQDDTEVHLVENHLSKLQLEMGIFGVIFFYLFSLSLIIRWLKRWRKPADRIAINLAGPLSAYCVTILALSFVIGGFDSPPTSIFFWVLLGIVARLSNWKSPTVSATVGPSPVPAR